MKNALLQTLRAAREWRTLRRTPYGMGPAVVFSLVTFFAVFGGQVFTLAGPDIVRRLNVSIGTLAHVQQFVGVLAIPGALGLGWWADRHRRVPLYVAGTLIGGAAASVIGVGRTTFTYGLPNTISNVGSTAAEVPLGSLLPDYYPVEARGRVYALLGLTSSVATVISPLLVGEALAALGITLAFGLVGVPLVVMAVVAAAILREPIRGYFERSAMGADEEVARIEDEPQSFGEAWRTTWAVRTIRRIFIAQVVLEFGLVALFFFNFFLFEHYGLDALQRGLIQLPSAAAAVLGAFLGGGLVDVLGRERPGRVLTVFGVFGVIAAVGIGLIGLGPPLPVLVLAFAVLAFGSALLGPAVGAVISQVIPPTIRTQGVQILGLSGIPALIFGLGLFTVIQARYGYTPTFEAAVPFFLIAGLILATSGGFFDTDRRNALLASMASHEWRVARAAGQGKLLVCRGVDVTYDGVQVLFGVDFDVEQGEIVALLGTNGAGKSTLLRAICGIQEASGGAVIIDGRDTTHMPPHEIAARGVACMPGGRGVFPSLSVADNLTLAGWIQGRTEGLDEVYELFPVLQEKAGAAAGLLSGGEQQMLALAQTMLAHPRLLLIDELTLGLAPGIVASLLAAVRRISARGTTVVIVEQSVSVALELAHRAVFMEKGEVKFVGATAELLARPDILRAVYVRGVATVGAARPRRPTTPEALERGPVLEAQAVTKAFGGIAAVDQVSFTLHGDEVLGLIGPNGSGKTTLLDIVSGFTKPDSGAVLLSGQDITSLRPDQRSARGLVRRFQDARQFPSLTVREDLALTLDRQLAVRSIPLAAVGFPASRRAERRLRLRVDELIDLLELGSYRDKLVGELSTGVRRLVDLACLVGLAPQVMLLDEPSTGVAQAESAGLAAVLRRIQQETGAAMLVIEHDMRLLTAVADEFIALAQGEVVVRGAPADVLQHPRVVASYLGDEADTTVTSGRGS